MAKPKKPKPQDEDEAQSARFIEAARDLEAAGELSPTDADAAMSRLVGNARMDKRRGD